MADDNFAVKDALSATRLVALDQVTYSDDEAGVQLVRIVQVTGSEGSKTVVDLPGDSANGLDVDVTRLPALVAGTAYIGKVRQTDGTNDLSFSTAFADGASNTVTAVPGGAYAHLFNGTTWDRMRGDTTNGLDVDVTRVPTDPFGANADAAATVGSAGTMQAKFRLMTSQLDAIKTAAEIIDDTVFADDATFTLGTHKVTMAGHAAVAIGSDPDAADAGDAVATLTNRHRVLYVIGGHPNTISVRLQFTAAQTDTAVITVGAGNKIVVTSFQITLDNASTVFPSVRIGFGAANTPTTTAFGAHGGVPAGGGFGRGDGSGVIAQGADGEDLRITTVGAATGNGFELCVSYHILPS